MKILFKEDKGDEKAEVIFDRVEMALLFMIMRGYTPWQALAQVDALIREVEHG